MSPKNKKGTGGYPAPFWGVLSHNHSYAEMTVTVCAPDDMLKA